MTTRNTGAATTRHTQTRRPGSTSTPGQWWKVWILLAGAGTTVLGWMSFPQERQPLASNLVSRSASMPLEEAATVEPVGGRTPVSPSVRQLPAMPQRPVFRAPVTRTRRS